MSNNLFLTLIGAVGIGALLMSMDNSSKASTKEDWALPGFPFKAIMQTGVSPCSQTQGSNKNLRLSQSSRPSSSLNFSENPTIIKSMNNMMGSKPVVNGSQFVSYPGYQQSTPLRSPSIALPPMIRYKPPTTNEMGISDAYRCQAPQETKEGFYTMVDESNPNPKTGLAPYSAGNYNKMVESISQSLDDDVESQCVSAMGADGTMENVVVWERPMTTTLKGGRFNQNGCRDLIRGDLAIAVDPSQNKWFQSSAQPAAVLTTGALQVLCGNNESTNNMAKFLQENGSISNTIGGALYSPGQYNAMQMRDMQSGIGGADYQVTAFA